MFDPKPLGDAVTSHMGGGTPPRQVPSYWGGDIPWASVKDFSEDSEQMSSTQETITRKGLYASASNLIPAGTPLVCTRMAVGRAAMSSVPLAINQDVKALYPAPGVTPHYLLAVMQYAQRFAEAQSIGSTVKGIRIEDYLALPVPQAPEAEQPKIAEVLVTVNKAIHQTEAIVEKLKQVKQGLLHDLLTRGVEANGELRPGHDQAPHLYQESRLGWIPRDWTLRSVASLGEIRSGSTPSREKADRYFHPEGTPWVKTLDLNEDVIRNTDECVTVAALRESSCSVLPVDSVLIAMYGGWEQIGRTAILSVPAATNQAISTVTISDSDVVPEYVLRALQHGRPRWKRVAASTRKDPNITKADVETFELPMPSTKDEQIAIVTRFRALLTRLAVEQLELHKRQEEKAGAMDDLLTGRVRVTPLLTQ
jgi:type I restriction enzyme S subunit